MKKKYHCSVPGAVIGVTILTSFIGVPAKDTAPPIKGSASSNVIAAKLVLPPVHYAVPGLEMEIIFPNAVLPEPKAPFRFSVECDVGDVLEDRLRLDASSEEVGDHTLTVTLRNDAGKKLDEASTIVRIVPKNSGKGETISLLIMGDSLTNASIYPNRIADLLSGPGNPTWTMLGTYQPAAAEKNVFHEGYGGWTWRKFVSRWDPQGKQSGKMRNSPFLFLKGDGKPALDIGRYFIENCGGKTPDYLSILLGINDCFHVNPGDSKAVEDQISLMFQEAERFLSEFRKESADTEIGICLVPEANSRDGAFYANYKDKYTRWGWRRIQYRLVERQLEHFGKRESENLFIIPTSLVIDSTEGYPDNNAVHPNSYGYKQLAGEIYAWMKWRMSLKQP